MTVAVAVLLYLVVIVAAAAIAAMTARGNMTVYVDDDEPCDDLPS